MESSGSFVCLGACKNGCDRVHTSAEEQLARGVGSRPHLRPRPADVPVTSSATLRDADAAVAAASHSLHIAQAAFHLEEDPSNPGVSMGALRGHKGAGREQSGPIHEEQQHQGQDDVGDDGGAGGADSSTAPGSARGQKRSSADGERPSHSTGSRKGSGSSKKGADSSPARSAAPSWQSGPGDVLHSVDLGDALASPMSPSPEPNYASGEF